MDLIDEYPAKETGGVLLGRTAADAYEIDEIIGPGPLARHGSVSFIRDGDYAQGMLLAAHARTNGRVTYLGEWHSHVGDPTPSPTDAKSLMEISKDGRYHTPDPLLLVVDARSRRSRLFEGSEGRIREILTLSRGTDS